MNIVKRNFKGKEINVVYNCPCDSCSRYKTCKLEKTYCSAFTEYINYGWYGIDKIQKRLKKL